MILALLATLALLIIATIAAYRRATARERADERQSTPHVTRCESCWRERPLALAFTPNGPVLLCAVCRTESPLEAAP